MLHLGDVARIISSNLPILQCIFKKGNILLHNHITIIKIRKFVLVLIQHYHVMLGPPVYPGKKAVVRITCCI